MSRMMAARAVICPSVFRIGQAEMEISTRLASLVSPTPSNWPTLSPRGSLSAIHFRLARWSPGGQYGDRLSHYFFRAVPVEPLRATIPAQDDAFRSAAHN